MGSGSLNIGNGTITTTLAFTGTTSRAQNLTVADGSTAGVIDVSSGNNFTLTGILQQTGSNATTKIGKSGAGTMTLSGTATYQGQLQIGQGSVVLNNNTALGTNTSTANRGVDLGLNVGDVSQSNNVSLLANNGFTVGQSIYIAPNTGGASRTIGLNGAGSATFNNEIYLGGDMTVNAGTGTVTLSGVVTNVGALVANGGTVVLSGNNDYTGNTIVNSGILRLGASNRISSVSPIVLAGGTFSSGATTGFTDTLGTLMLNAGTSSTLELGTGNHTLTFANSSALTWGTGATLTITGWAGTAGQSNTSGGKIIVGAGGLTPTQLSKITFSGYAGTPIIVGGELVPPGPILAVTAGSLAHGNACVNSAASTITYTISNTGATATGVTVVSNSAEFVVSNAPTSITGGGSATYQVTFTPAASGTRNATITIGTSTPNSNAPVTSAISGNGNPLPTASVSGTTTVCRNATSPSITFTGANATAPYTFTYSINGGSNQTITTIVGNSVTVAVPTTAAGTFTYALVSVSESSATTCSNAQSGSATVTVDAGTTYYADTDNDGFGDAASPVVSCTGLPVGTVTNNTDCAPADPTKWRTGSFYVDADNDGYYNGNPEATTVCYGTATPSGYTPSILGTDCDDANAEANPNHVEIAGNSIDDNCDGTIDEVAPLSSLVPSLCGSTLSNIANTIYATQPATATAYRFEVTNGANVRTFDSATNSFSLLNLGGGVTYGTTYAIRVAVKTNGFWRSYSASCNITTPGAPATTNVIASQCGSTLANIANLIYCNQVTAANQYRFEVTNGANVRTYDTSLNRFALSNLTGGGTYGTTYAVRVALRFGATWEPYGPACDVTTPATPGITNLVSSQCGVTISNRWTTLYANQVPDAQGYRFEVTNGATTRFYDTTVNRFALGNLAGGVTASTVYTVRVAVLYNSVYGAFGSACTVTTAAAFTRTAQDAAAVFVVKSYPNPFADTFKLDVNTTSEAGVALKVYDMIGKLVESRQVNISEMGSVELGSRYSSGVYNVIVTQGENVETLRVIKR